jgi:hypothetical protein
MPQKETLMCIARCKTKDAKIRDYYVHRIAGAVVIIGPNLERHRCHPGSQPNRRSPRDSRLPAPRALFLRMCLVVKEPSRGFH